MVTLWQRIVRRSAWCLRIVETAANRATHRRLLPILADGRVLRYDVPGYASEQDLEAPHGVLTRDGMIDLAFKFLYGNTIAGDYFEFGCYSGRTFRMAYRHSRRPFNRSSAEFAAPVHLWAFDSFEGLPAPGDKDQHPLWYQGKFATSVENFHQLMRSARVPPEAYSVVPGFYSDTLTPTLQEQMLARGVRAGVVYIDCDFYDSARTVLEFMVPFLQQGTVLCFDDFYCYAADPKRGEQLALTEWLATHPELGVMDYYQFGWGGKSFLVRQDAPKIASSLQE